MTGPLITKIDSHTKRLPRLLYVADVPVESSYHGSALVYRLLQDYPPERLLVIEAKPLRSLPERRLSEVEYRQFSIGAERWLNTRLSRWASTWCALKAASSPRLLLRSFDGFDPEAVLTIAHGYSWLAAARMAMKMELPLHLIVHDDWPSMTAVVPAFRPWLHCQFNKVYRQAASRFCVSPGMEAEYRRKYGISGHVMYPSYSKNCPPLDLVPRAYRDESRPLVGAYAGNIFDRGNARLIATLAQCLEHRGGSLILFGPHSPEDLKSLGLDCHNILPQGLVSSQEMIMRLRKEADFLFVPMPFGVDGDAGASRFSFPSKLTDYTATGLPLLICGPDCCSAVRWAQQNRAVAEVVTSPRIEDIGAAVNRLEQAQHRELLGRAAMELGQTLFSHRTSVEILNKALLRAHYKGTAQNITDSSLTCTSES